MAKTPAIIFDGSKPLRNNLHESYARLRAAALPRIVAFRKAGNTAKNDHVADTNSFRLEKKPGVRERIDYLVRQAEDRIIEKRQRIEERLWSIHEGNIQDLFEVAERAKTNKAGEIETDENGRMLTVREERPRLISDLAPEVAQLIEDVTVDRKGRLIPRLYSKPQANQELRKMLGIGRTDDRPESDVGRLSDAELIQQLADQAKELGVEIDLNYSFAQQPSATETDVQDSQVIDADPAADVSSPEALTNELAVSSAAPPEARRLPKAGRGKR
jgi:hypothetical protein